MGKLIKKIGCALIVSVFCLLSHSFADPPVGNDPKEAAEAFKGAIKVLEPSADYYFDILSDDWTLGTSVDILALKKLHNSLYNVDLRAGWGEAGTAYLTLSLNLQNLTKKELAKYVHLGWMGGRSFQDDSWVTGPVVGLKGDF